VLGHSRVRGPRAGGRRPPPTATTAPERLAIGDYSQGSRRQQRGQREPGRQRGLATAARRGVAGGRAGVAAAAVPAPAARSGVAGAATPGS